MNYARYAALLAALALAGCSRVPQFVCINGTLHKQWDVGTWVQQDGKSYIGYPDGPMPCAMIAP